MISSAWLTTIPSVVALLWWYRRRHERMGRCHAHVQVSVPLRTAGVQTSPPCLITEQSHNVEEHAFSFVCVKRFSNAIDSLARIAVHEWLYDRPLVRLFEDVNADDAIERIRSEGATCALVYDMEGTLLGVLEMTDIVRHMVSERRAASEPIRGLLRICTIAPDTFSMDEVCQHLRAGVRHIAVASANGIHKVVSQRAVAQALHEAASRCSTLDAALKKPLCDCNIPSFNRVVRAQHTCTAREAFRNLLVHGITSLPVCDATGCVCGVISATDVLQVDDGLSVDENVCDFVKRSRQRANITRAFGEIVNAGGQTTLGEALRIMLRQKVHHVYVLDDLLRAIGVVSFVDILNNV